MIISNGLQCRVSLPSKLIFTVVVQKGWKLMVKQRKENPKKESNSTLSGLPVSTGGCHCCHGYKITNIYEGLHSSHRHLKKHVCCQVHLNSLKARKGREGDPVRRPLWNHGTDMTEKRTCTTVLRGKTSTQNQPKTGCKMNKFATIVNATRPVK